MIQMWMTRISIYETEVDDQNIDMPNEGNGDSVAVPAGPHQHDVENIPPTSANNPDGEGDPTNGKDAARMKFVMMTGLFAAGSYVPWTIFFCIYEKNLCKKFLFGAPLLLTPLAFPFCVTLFEGLQVLLRRPFGMNNPKSIGRINFVAEVVSFSTTMAIICLMIRGLTNHLISE